MGANQSSKTLHLRQAQQQLTAELEQRNKSSGDCGQANKKDSFSRQQLNRLMGRRSNREQVAVDSKSGQFANNNNDANDEWQSPPARRPLNKSISEQASGDSLTLLNNNNNNNNNATEPYFVTPTRDDEWTLPETPHLVRHQQQQQQAANDKFIVTPSSGAHDGPLRVAVKQPLDSSVVRHQSQQVVGITPRQQQQQQAAGSGTESASRQVHQIKQQGLKSSCSPSSASSSSALSNSSSSRHSSSESFKLHAAASNGGGGPTTPAASGNKQEHQQLVRTKRANEPSPAATTTRPQQKPNTTTTTALNGNNGNNYAIKQAHKTLVAMPQHRRNASSGGQAMSWSKQQQHTMMMLANGGLQGNQQQRQQQQPDSLEHPTAAYQVFDQRQQQAQYHHPQLHPFAISAATAAEEAQQYYATNYLQNQRQQAEFAGYASAPLQRRQHDKWLSVQQQYQMQQPLYNQTNLDFPIYQQQQQHQHQHVVPPHEEQAAYLQHLHQYNLMHQYHQPANELLSSPLVAGRTNLEQTRRSKSLSKSSAILGTGKSRSRNPLAAIFPFAPTQSHKEHQSRKQAAPVFGSNTIHLSSSKSHQNLMLLTKTNTSKSSNSTNNFNLSSSASLKRVKSSPLSAQQTTYEAMRTIDMYLIRQIARSCMDFEMEQKIDLEIRLRELASQSMLEARTEIDVLEVEKSLLASDQRMNCYAQQLEQQRKRLSATPSLGGGTNSVDSGRGSKASGGGGGGRRAQRSDVIGGNTGVGGETGAGSPGYSSLLSSSRTSGSAKTPAGSSSQSSPSKLSPVSGQSANDNHLESSSQMASARDQDDGASTMSRSRRRSNNVMRQPNGGGGGSIASGGGNTLSRLQNRRTSQSHKSQKQRQRERLDQQITAQSNINCLNATRNTGTLSVSDLRVPLMWRDVDHFKGRGDYRRYAVFCLLKIGSQIYDTRLISDVDRQLTDLTFDDDVIVFNQVEHDFELELEVYSCVYLEQFSLSSTPRKLKEKLSNSVSRAMGRRLGSHATASVNYMKELEAYDKSYRFAMIASARLSLADASETTKTYDLRLVSPEAHGRQQQQQPPTTTTTASLATLHRNSMATTATSAAGVGQSAAIVTPPAGNQKDQQRNTLPLFGHFCCQLQVRPDVFDKHVKSGYLRVAAINLPADLQQEHARKDDEDLNAHGNTDSMLRSALAASSKLANISMSSSSSTIHWAMLRNFTLNLWQVDEHRIQQALRRGHAPQVDISRKQPVRVSIDKYARLLRVSNSSLTLETDKGCFVLAVYNPATPTTKATGDELGQWLRSIEQMIYDSHLWGSVLNHYPPARV